MFKSALFSSEIYIRSGIYEGLGGGIGSIDELVEYLKDITKGYDLITVGNSSGGYIASIIGAKLNASLIINIAGQFSIAQYAEDNYEYPELYCFRNEGRCNKYFDITDLIKKSEIPIIYFYSGKNIEDLKQTSYIKFLPNIYMFKFDSRMHGITAKPYNYPYLINLSFGEWMNLYDIYKNKFIKAEELALKTMSFDEFLISNTIYWVKNFPKIMKNQYHVLVKPYLMKIKISLNKRKEKNN